MSIIRLDMTVSLDGFVTGPHDGVPIFVLTHDIPADPPPGSVRYVNELRTCAEAARSAAGDSDVVVLGAGAAQALVRAGSGRREPRTTGHAPALPRRALRTDQSLQPT